MGLLVRHVIELLIALVTLLTAAQPEATRTFTDDRVDLPPAGFKFSTSEPTPPPDQWLVRREGDNHVLVFTGDPERRRGRRGDSQRGKGSSGNQRGGGTNVADPERRRGFALALLDGPSRTNLSAAASFKNARRTGRAGFVWRYQDSQNYYMVHLDIDEADQEIGLYRIVNGNRVNIGREADMQLRQSDWHELKVFHENDHIRVYLGGIKVFDVEDKTFRGPGAVGLWVAADTIMYFDNLSLAASDPR
jgi:hypothetical protein